MGETGKGRNGVAFLISSRRGEGGDTQTTKHVRNQQRTRKKKKIE